MLRYMVAGTSTFAELHGGLLVDVLFHARAATASIVDLCVVRWR